MGLSGQTGEECAAAARSRAFGLFAQAVAHPGERLSEAIRSGTLARDLSQTLRTIDLTLLEGTDWEALADVGEGDALCVEYTRLFDVGPMGPPCPPYGGMYGGERMKILEEVVRFYNHFGLTLSDARHDPPDHATTQLEFLHYLAFREAEALQQGIDPGPFQRAQRDFVARHPGRWIPKLRGRLEGQAPMRFYSELFRLLERFLENVRASLEARLAPPAPPSSGIRP